MSRYNKLHETYIFNVLLINIITVLFLGSIWMIHEYRQFNNEIKVLKDNFLESQKAIIKNEVEDAIIYIDNIHKDTEQELNNTLKSRVDEILGIVNTIYLSHKNKQSDNEIKEILKDILRNLKFGELNNYVFILSDNGVEELNPISPDMEGKNLLLHPDALIRNEITKEIGIAQSKGEGLIKHKWINDRTGTVFQKVTYIKYFKPFHWIIGTGIDYNDYIKSRQHNVIHWLSHVRFGKNRDGYIFVNYQNGDPLLTNGMITIGQPNNWSLKDPFGVMVMKEEFKASQKPGGGYINYSWRKLFTVDEKAYGIEKPTSPKLSFIKGYNPWKWMVGAGFYLDDVDLQIAQKRVLLNQIIRQHSLVIILSLIFSILISLVLIRLINLKIETNFKRFIHFFSEASTGKATIDLENLSYVEFGELAVSANNMIEQRELAEQGFKLIVELFPFPVCLFKGEEILYLNPQWIKIIGYTNENVPTMNEMLEKCVTDPEEREKAIGWQKEMLISSSETPDMFLNITCKDNLVRYMKMNYKSMKNKGNMIILEDYTDRKKFEDDMNSAKVKAEEADSLKSTFLANMSHEIRTPMNAIVGFSELLQNDNLTVEKRKKYLSYINRSTESLLNLINDILDFSKIEAGQLNIRKIHGNLGETLASVDAEIRSIRGVMGKDLIQIKLNYELIPEMRSMFADFLRLKQIIMNLLSNALKFTSRGDIEYGCSLFDKNTLQFYVKDTGIGIKPNHLEDIFNRFTKIEEDLSRVFRGAGLGLTITKRLVEAMGGKIWVESIYGEGSVFYFTLPVNNINKSES